MSSSVTPLLSICIPTYNRAELLRSALYSIVRQAATLGDLVEVVVSDNASTDHTADVVAWAQTLGPVRYHRNAENIGAGRNFLQLAQHLAQGEYCWLLGDDDLLREGAVAEVVSALREHPEIDYAFVNNSFEDGQGREPGLIENTKNYVSAVQSCFIAERRVVERWEQIIGFSRHGSLFAFIGNHVLRTRLWREQQFSFETDEGFPSVEASFPHACTVARHMTGRRALYLGQPLIIAFLSAQEWHSLWPMVQLVRLPELVEYVASLGAEKAMVHRYRNIVLASSSDDLWRLLTDVKTPGRQNLHLGQMCRKYWRCSGLYMMLLRYPAKWCLLYPSQSLARGAARLLRRSSASL